MISDPGNGHWDGWNMSTLSIYLLEHVRVVNGVTYSIIWNDILLRHCYQLL